MGALFSSRPGLKQRHIVTKEGSRVKLYSDRDDTPLVPLKWDTTREAANLSKNAEGKRIDEAREKPTGKQPATPGLQLREASRANQMSKQ